MATDFDAFSLFQMQPSFNVDLSALEAAYQKAIVMVHPDRFASRPAAERRVAEQWSARINEAYATLKDPLKRAIYLCESRGASIEAETNTAMPADFLMLQIEWREKLEFSRADATAIESLASEVMSQYRTSIRLIETAIDEQNDMAVAVAQVRRLMFIDKFRLEIERVAAN